MLAPGDRELLTALLQPPEGYRMDEAVGTTFSLDLVDYWLFVIDVAGGDDIPRKRGPGVVKCDLLVINKFDLAPHVGVDIDRMFAEARDVRQGRPVRSTCPPRPLLGSRRRPVKAIWGAPTS